MRLNHVNIRVTDLDASIRFYRDALGLTQGERPEFGFPGAWLYDEDKPAVHLNLALEAPSAASGSFDHVAFRTDDLAGLLARLDALGVHYYGLRHLPDGTARQCFMKDPNGVTIEVTGP